MSRAASLILPVIVMLAAPAVSLAQLRAVGGSYPMPPASPAAVTTPAPAPIGWRNSTVLGLSSGLGSPYGLIGAFVGYFPWQQFQLEVGGGYSAGFGPSVAALGRVGFNPGDSSFLALGFGLSTNFSDYAYAENCVYPANSSVASRCIGPATPRVAIGSASALWLNFEVSEDVRLNSMLGGRIAAGIGLLLNPGAFPTALGCPSDGLGQTPCGVGASRANDAETWIVHVRIDLYAVIVRGDR